MHPRLKDRLSRLEEKRATAVSAEPPFMGTINLVVLLMAGHLGGMTEREAAGEAYGRALGYTGSSEVRSVLTAKSDSPTGEERDRRHAEAMHRLLALKDVSADDGGGSVRDALEALFDDLPEHVRHHPFGQQVRVSLSQVVDMYL
ncbi:hypothetical protein FF100_34310 [Methylobacterium terricola]|uniref:Uncharacterized protein n=1 Tax=Methylobacterium terricola TaxID=2583531 RepID=A0A5C4L6G2_9HYPH|nr:hypothetical protein [Methylobacterium terricola]TNC06525.1 hypothetical protein FF100_34310 [Methylobacterium terricola]